MSKELGDFQTPSGLVDAILRFLNSAPKSWARVLEPTCGSGNFIKGLLNLPVPPREIQGFEIQESHFERIQHISEQPLPSRVVVKKANFFELDLRRDIQWAETGPLLVVGNPPWVTNAELGVLGSNNLPQKRNFKGFKGFDALMGGSNFDIAEYVWLKLIWELADENPTIALLCKTSVARNVLQFASKSNLPITYSSIRRIDSKQWFGVAADACLFYVEIGSGKRDYRAEVFRDLEASEVESVIQVKNGHLVANAETYERLVFVSGMCPLEWRQGLKHDAVSIMELTYDVSGVLRNGLHEPVNVEPDYIYPLLKSSDLFRQRTAQPRKAVIVTQKHMNEDTHCLEQNAPHLWNYLNHHAEVLKQRKSSIYAGKPPFTIFGIGDYSFTPYKVAISGMYKTPKFQALGPISGRPIMLDDTCYLIACHSPEQAALLASLLNDPICLDFIQSTIFPDSKRPITKKILQRLDLRAILEHTSRELLLVRASIELERLGVTAKSQVWPPVLAELLELLLSPMGTGNSAGLSQLSFGL